MTRGSDTKPVRRLLASTHPHEGSVHYVVELRERTLVIRPKGTRRGGAAEIITTPSAIYHRALMARAEAAKPRRAVRVKRGLL